MWSYVKAPNVRTLLLTVVLLVGCGQQERDYGFVIKEVSVTRGYQALNIKLEQELALSQQAVAALQHGVTLTIILELELRNESSMVVVKRAARRFHLQYRALSERYQLNEGDSEKSQAFYRLRHVLAAIDNLNVRLATGPLPPGNYELRTRILLDESLLPAPMQLPALFSSQWQHDSEWSLWPFKVNV